MRHVYVPLASEIERFLQADPRYSTYPVMYFHLQTNNSRDRANCLDNAWRCLPVGSTPEPLMFVCGTGRGDGCYEVRGQFDGDVPGILNVDLSEVLR